MEKRVSIFNLSPTKKTGNSKPVYHGEKHWYEQTVTGDWWNGTESLIKMHISKKIEKTYVSSECYKDENYSDKDWSALPTNLFCGVDKIKNEQRQDKTHELFLAVWSSSASEWSKMWPIYK